MLTPASSIALIGFHGASLQLAERLAARGCAVRAWGALPEQIEAAGLDAMPTLAAALRGAKLVIVAVDASDSTAMARDAAALLVAGQIYLDVSGAAAAVHESNAKLIEGGQVDYAAGCVQEPMLIAGRRAETLAAALVSLGCAARAVMLDKITSFTVPAEIADSAPRRAVVRGALP